jgi:hypothetical protein
MEAGETIGTVSGYDRPSRVGTDSVDLALLDSLNAEKS